MAMLRNSELNGRKITASKIWGVIKPKVDVILDRLPTKVRLMQRGMSIDGHCLFCHYETEIRDHIFAECVVECGLK